MVGYCWVRRNSIAGSNYAHRRPSNHHTHPYDGGDDDEDEEGDDDDEADKEDDDDANHPSNHHLASASW